MNARDAQLAIMATGFLVPACGILLCCFSHFLDKLSFVFGRISPPQQSAGFAIKRRGGTQREGVLALLGKVISPSESLVIIQHGARPMDRRL